MYIYIYVYINVYIYMYLYIYVSIYIYMYTNINLLNGWVNPRVTLRDIHINFRSVSDRISVVIFRFGAITDKPSQMSWAPYGCMLSPMGLTEHWAPFLLKPFR